MPSLLRRELRVAFSPRGQPVWFRAIKWIVIIALTVLFWRRLTFWWTAAAAIIAAIAVHLFYRHKTHRWTRAWGGWNDLEAGRVDSE